jgi:hypothetical protein
MIIDVPGLLLRPEVIEREWVAGLVHLRRSESISSRARLSLSLNTIPTGIDLRQPIGLRSAASVPQLPYVAVTRPPNAHTPVDGVVVDFVDPAKAELEIDLWLAATPARAKVPSPSLPTPRPPRLVAGLAVLWLEIPKGPRCP